MSGFEREPGLDMVPSYEAPIQYPTLDALQARLGEIFSERDRVYFDERYARIRLFENGVADLFDGLRRSQEAEDFEIPCARVVARIFCIANSFERLSVANGMMEKFPIKGCAYCGASPCVCAGNRGEVQLATQNEIQQNWSLRQWQRHLDNLYGEPNRARGIWFATTRLAVETNELVAAEDNIRLMTIEEAKRAYEHELADGLAWTVAIANILGVDLQKATEDRFGNGCNSCGSVPCQCLRHNMQQVKFG
jgi:NTP pyrophosphatase (non-canonical NTP hydrolase)